MSFGPDNRKERRPRRGLAALIAGLCLVGAAMADPLPWRQYPGVEYFDYELPTDHRTPAEWVFARLMYPSIGWGGAWEYGGTSWTIDYPKGDRHIAALVRRLSVIDARSVEQPVNLDDGDDVFNWPWLYAVEVGEWQLTDPQAAKLREYLLRGGFLMVDDFHGSLEWEIFVESMRRVFPDRPIVDLPDDHPVFHVVFDLAKKHQIANWQALHGRGLPYRSDGSVPQWRGIMDDDGHVMVVIAFNNDVGDSWQWANSPDYPHEDANLGIRLGVNFAVYSMTH